jgi:SAM-dependent methyltransferase
MPSYELTPCPVCAANAPRQIAGAEDIRREVEMLWEFHGRRLEPNTPPTRLTDRVSFSQRPPLAVVQCTRCGLVYRNPRERSEELRRIYAGDAPDDAAMSSLFENQRAAYRTQARRLTRLARRPGDGLEVGSYVGAFLAAAREAGWRFEGVDVNEAVNAFARARGFTVTCGDLGAVDHDRRFDAIAIWNCFDQLPDPRRAAMAARTLVREGGVLAMRVPNGAFYAALRRHLDGRAALLARALLAHNNLLTFPYRHGFTPHALRLLVERAGFRVHALHGDALVPVADEWTRRWAALEERVIKTSLRILARGGARTAWASPWLELYAVAC